MKTSLKTIEQTQIDNVVFMLVPEQMTPEQRDHWQTQAAYWAIKQEDALVALEYAQRNRENALRMLGMLATENGLA